MYKVSGKTVLKKSGGKWKVKAHAKSPGNAKKMVRLLYGVEHGMKVNRSKSPY